MKLSRIIIAAIAVIAMAGCRSSRHAQKNTSVVQEGTILTGWDDNGRVKQAEVEKRNTSVSALQARMDVTLSRGSKTIHCTGTYRVKRGELVQMNLVYNVLFVSMNVGTLELTPDYVMVVDRVGRRYCKVGYDEVPQLRSQGLTFADIEPLFWGEKGDVKGKALTCTFGNWTQLSEGRFPAEINLTLNKNGKAAKAVIGLNNIKEGAAGFALTDVSRKYQQVGLDEVMKALKSVIR